MSPRRRKLTIGALVVLLVSTEVAYQTLRPPEAYVKVVNEGITPIEDLRLVFGSREQTVPLIEAGSSARVPLGGYGKHALKVTFRQDGNSMTGFEVVGFNPVVLERGRFVYVLTIRPNEFERSQEDGDPPLWSRVGSSVSQWLEKSLDLP